MHENFRSAHGVRRLCGRDLAVHDREDRADRQHLREAMRVSSVQEENVSLDVLRHAQPRDVAARGQTPRRRSGGRKLEVCCGQGLPPITVSAELCRAAENGPEQHPFYEQVAGADEQGDFGLSGE